MFLCTMLIGQNENLSFTTGLRRTSTSSEFWISEFLVTVLIRPDGNEGLKDPGRRGRQRPEEPCSLIKTSRDRALPVSQFLQGQFRRIK